MDSDSRPSSRAQSDVSFGDRPGSSGSVRSVAHEIEHIKSLISRSQNSPARASGSITAQLFRQRSTSTPVTTAQIIHELDQLKKRVKNEQRPVVQKRPSQINPDSGSESESEYEDALDEREEELEKAREEVMRVKEDSEKLLEAAEHKVDVVTFEKEDLEGTLQSCRQQLEKAVADKNSADARLRESHDGVMELNTQVQGLKKALLDHGGQLDAVRAENERSKRQHQEAKEKVARLGEEHANALEALRKLKDEYTSSEKSLRDQLTVIQEKHDAAASESQQHYASNQELHRRLADAETTALNVGRDIEEHKKLLQDALKDVDQHSKEHEELRRARDTYQERAAKLAEEVDEYQVKLGGALFEKDRSEKDLQKKLDDTTADHDRKVKDLQTKHEDELKSVRAAVDKRVEGATEELTDALNWTKAEHSSALAKSQASHERALQDASKVAAEYLKELEQVKTLAEEVTVKLKTTEADLEATRKTHAVELEGLRSDHAMELRQVKIEAATTLQKARDGYEGVLQKKESEHSTAISELTSRHASEKEALSSDGSQQLERLKREKDKAVADLQADHDQILKRKNEDHQKALDLAERRYKALEASLAQELGNIQGQHDKQMTELHEKHDADVSVLKAEHDGRFHALQQVQEEAFREASVQRKALEGAHTLALAERDAAHETQISTLKQQHANQVNGVQAELRAAREELQASHVGLTDVAAKQQNNLNELRNDHQREIEQLRSEHTAERLDLHTKHESELDKVRQQMSSVKYELTGARAEHENAMEGLRKAHDAALVSSKAEQAKEIEEAKISANEQREQDHASALASVRAEHVTIIEELRADHYRAILQRQQDNETMLTDLKNDHQRSLETAQQASGADYQKLLQNHSDEIKSIRESGARVIEDLRRHHAQTLDAIKAEGDEAVRKATEAQQEDKAMHRKQLDNMQAAHNEVMQARLAEAEAVAFSRSSNLQSQYDKALLEAERLKEEELEKIRQNHQQSYADLKASAEKDAATVQDGHRQAMTELETTLVTQINDAKASHERALAEQEAVWTAKLTQLKQEHEKASIDLHKSSDQSVSARIEELQSGHSDALSKAIQDARLEAQAKATNAEQQHRTALDAAVARVRQSGEAEVRNLKKRHQDAVAQIRSTAQKQEEKSQSETQASIENARLAAEQHLKSVIETHKAEKATLEAQHQSAIVNYQTQLNNEKSKDLALKQESHEAEVAALQSRLDASLTGHAEAERSVAALRQQVAQADQRIMEAKASADDEIVSLSQERDDLTSQLEKVQASLYELQSKYSGGSTTPKRRHASLELGNVRMQLETMQEERAAMRLTLQKHLDDKSELTRQNEFLVKELEALLAQRTRRPPPTQKSDALVQTEPFISEEPKADFATMQHIKEERRKSFRPITPMSPGRRQAKDEIDAAWQNRSFEDYLQNAQNELSELGSAITANETLFAQKIQEHVSELQRAKDQLAADYNTKLDRIAYDKKQLERMVLSKHAIEFAKDRRSLVAQYGADFDDPKEQTAVLTSLPVDDARALRSAEQQLVNDYNFRIARRKSQIALKHAEEFQTATREYDRRVAELVSTRAKLEGDLSVDPSKFEADYSHLRDMEASGRMYVANAAPRFPRGSTRRRDGFPDRDDSLALTEKRQSRPRSAPRTSNPRTSTSIPRSSSLPRQSEIKEEPEPVPAVPRVPYPGNRDSPEATSQPRRGSSVHPPVPTRSLMRAKNPTDTMPSHVTKRSVSEAISAGLPPKTPPRGSSKAAPTSINQSTGIDGRLSSSNVRREDSKASKASTATSTPKPGILRRMRNRLSAEINKTHMPALSFSRPGSRRNSTSSRPGSKGGMQPAPDIPTEPVPPVPLQHQRQHEAPAIPDKDHVSQATMSRWSPRRSKSQKLSSGMIYYNAPRQTSGPEYVSYDAQNQEIS